MHFEKLKLFDLPASKQYCERFNLVHPSSGSLSLNGNKSFSP